MAEDLSQQIRQQARELGFAACAIAAAAPMPDTRAQFDDRLDRGFLDGLPWMTHARAERATSPDLVLQGARSIVSLAAAYEHSDPIEADWSADNKLRGRVARYAWGRDYHRVLERALKVLCTAIDEAAPGSRSRVLVDYGPLAERAYAARAGLGWFGKSTNLLLPGLGSWVVLGEILTTAELEPDIPLRKTCGACRRCIDSCPTGALVDGCLLDNRLCISYQTIENRGPIPRELRPLIGEWLFGCDLCQEACPVGSRSKPEPMPGLSAANAGDRALELLPLLRLDDAAFRTRFAGRAIMRAKRDGLLRNACVVLGNLGDPRAVDSLMHALVDDSPLVRGHAAWALGRIGNAKGRALLQARLESESDAWVRDEIRTALGGDAGS